MNIEDTKATSPGDEVIDVRLPMKDYLIMKEMIERQRALNWFGRWMRNVGLVAVGGFITLVVFWDHIKRILGIASATTTGGS